MPKNREPQYDTLELNAKIAASMPIPAEYADRKATDDEVSLALLGAEKPVAIAVSPQDIARMYRDNYSPFAFTQYLLERFRDVGVPVEGSIRLRLAHGQITRWKMDAPPPDGMPRYVWLPQNYWDSIQAMGGLR